MALHPEQILMRDVDENLPIHIIAAARNLSDEESILCVDCFENKQNLVHTEFLNSSADYCCEDCFEFESKELIKRKLIIKPGMHIDSSIFTKFLFLIWCSFSLWSVGNGERDVNYSTTNDLHFG